MISNPFLQELENIKQQLTSKDKNISFYDYMNYAFDMRIPKFWQPIVASIPDNQRILILLPPGHRKTTTMVGYAAWCLATGRRKRIAIATHTVSYSSVILTQICDILASPSSISLVGKVIPDNPERQTKGWTKTQRWLFNDTYIKDPNLVALGVGSGTIGFRVDLIIADDVISQTNSMTPVMREKISSWFWGALYPRLEPDGQVIVTGSRFYEGDLYDEIMKQKDDWRVHVLKTSPDNPLWPEKFDKEWLEQKYRSNPLFFRAQYMQTPIREKAALDPGWLRFHYSTPEELAVFIGVDPCDKADGVDYFALAVLGVDQMGNMFILDGTKKQIDVVEQVKEILWFANRYHPITIAIEDRGALNPLMKDANFNIRTLRFNIPKTIRIQRLAEEFRNERITLPMLTSETPAEITKLFIEEWRSFGATSSHDDLLDAVYNAFEAWREGAEPAMTFSPLSEQATEGNSGYQNINSIGGFERIWSPGQMID